ncbi:MAG TPA: DUF433 domain-containing protein [bacterium]|nr:DUF433 domain-containing protein [bacterium]
MNWRKYIVSDKAVLVGKPVVKGTRLSVEFLLGLLAQGWSEEQILAEYSQLDKKALKALYAFTAESMREEKLFAFSRPAA